LSSARLEAKEGLDGFQAVAEKGLSLVIGFALCSV